MIIKTSELTGAAMNWVVASIEWPNDTGILNPELVDKQSVNEEYPFNKDWSLTGVILERERITVSALYAQIGCPVPEYMLDEWGAYIPLGFSSKAHSTATTAIIATLRCHVANKRGDEVEVPDHLL